MRAEDVSRTSSLFKVFVFACAALGAASSHAGTDTGANAAFLVADAAPAKLRATAMPQSVGSDFISYLEFSRQTASVAAGPVSLRARPQDPMRTLAAPAQVTPRSLADALLLTLLGVTLVVYQLFRKHRQLRPQPFSV